MGILAGAMTVARFRVVGDLSDGWRDKYRSRLNEFAFQEPPNSPGREEREGWVQVHNLLDTSFDDYNRWLYGDWAVFALRIDKRRLPAKLFKATLEKRCAEWCSERDVDRCPSSVKAELKERLEQEWLSRTLPSVGITEASWCLSGRYLLLLRRGEATAGGLRKSILQSCGP